MKVVVSRCFGGFGLSPQAKLLMLEKQGKQGYLYEKIYGKDYRDVTYNRIDDTKDKKGMSYYVVDKDLGATVSDTEEFWKHHMGDYDIERDDPNLIAVVEELGSKEASDWAAKLEVVEIPDGIDWVIDEYDGNESVEEAHRSW